MAAPWDMRSRRGLPSGKELYAYGLLNKQVIFPYAGRRLHFWLSRSLFSSDDIDTGTRALLTAIADRLGDLRMKTVLDLGCGSGIIGVALSALWPDQLYREQRRSNEGNRLLRNTPAAKPLRPNRLQPTGQSRRASTAHPRTSRRGCGESWSYSPSGN